MAKKPYIPGGSRRTGVLQIRLRPDERKQLERLAGAKKMTLADYLRHSALVTEATEA